MEPGNGMTDARFSPAQQTLVASFNALADEVQSLVDRKTILEHKLRYAQEQVRADCFLIPRRDTSESRDDFFSSRSGAVDFRRVGGTWRQNNHIS